MKFGCIGNPLKHSYSREIHKALGDYEYELCELSEHELEDFFKSNDFKAINVTIPYKKRVLDYVYRFDERALEIGSVNTIVMDCLTGKHVGYNTDIYGVERLLLHAGVALEGKKVVILGTGGTAGTVSFVAKEQGAREILLVSREKKEGAVTYEELYSRHTDAEVIINATPVGMFPNSFARILDLSKFEALSGVIDVIYNPLRTPLILDAMERGIAAEGGLYMLIAQAVRASEIFINHAYSFDTCDKVYKKIIAEKENVVLVGMPSSGKSTVGAELSKRLGRKFIDTDELITEKAGMTIPEIFEKLGEEKFRELESKAIREASLGCGKVIATGGGAILNPENVRALRSNGKIYFIDRPLECLVPTEDRPLSKSKAEIERLYEKRYPLYSSLSDVRIDASEDALTVTEKIIEDFTK